MYASSERVWVELEGQIKHGRIIAYATNPKHYKIRVDGTGGVEFPGRDKPELDRAGPEAASTHLQVGHAARPHVPGGPRFLDRSRYRPGGETGAADNEAERLGRFSFRVKRDVCILRRAERARF